jgi:predicted nucleotide-binding protein (sugar kinase/HSP70/actin superfamily)
MGSGCLVDYKVLRARSMEIGIPRALGYYMYYPFWYGFFTELGFNIKLSSFTTKKLLSAGSALVVPETCLPVKVYVGHVLDLIEKKGVENIYSPSIQSIAHKIYNCSKLRGLPDLVRNVIKRDFKLIEPTLDKSVKNQGLYDYLYESVEPFGITSKRKIKEASKAGWASYNRFHELCQQGVNYKDALNVATGKIAEARPVEKIHSITVAVISHHYNLYDDYLSMRVLEKLQKFGVNVLTAENLTREQHLEGISKLNTVLYWANEFEMTGAAGYYMYSGDVDGICTITAFGCGPDSLMIERITRFAKHTKIPLLNLTLDEHTGEAGIITRLEAFTDMLIRKKRIISGFVPFYKRNSEECKIGLTSSK